VPTFTRAQTIDQVGLKRLILSFAKDIFYRLAASPPAATAATTAAKEKPSCRVD
jgi:hypothetical protein